MPIPKPARHGPSMDMTAMCDVAFLLLTFFIMTTQFKSEESVTVDTPSSISEIKVDDKDLATVSIDNKGHYYFGLVNPKERPALLQAMGQKYGVSFSPEDQAKFSKMAENGMTVKGLRQYLALTDMQKSNIQLEGIPNDSVKSELVDWVKTYMQEINPNAKLAIKGDVKTQYPAIKGIFNEFGKANINKFQLITDAETPEK